MELDDIVLSSRGSIQSIANELQELNSFDLGPIVELIHTHPTLVHETPSVIEYIRNVKEFKNSRYPKGIERERILHDFKIQFKRSAERSGMPIRTARALTGLLGELYDNTIIHSMNEESSSLFYSWKNGRFCFAICDHGVGVLKSLTQCQEYSHIEDHGDALALAIENGISRFGSGAGRGFGFNQLFVALSNNNCRIRLRSGDHALELSQDNTPEPIAEIKQRAMFDGFFISVTWEP